MATNILHVGYGKRGRGADRARYVARLGVNADRVEELVFLEAFVPQRPAQQSAEYAAVEFFRLADKFERKNGRVFVEVMASIPREAEDPGRWAHEFAQRAVGQGHFYLLCVHVRQAADGKPNPHLHMMVCPRRVDQTDRPIFQYFARFNPAYPNEGGARKDPNWGKRRALYRMRSVYHEMIRTVVPDWSPPPRGPWERKIGPRPENGSPEQIERWERRRAQVLAVRDRRKMQQRYSWLPVPRPPR